MKAKPYMHQSELRARLGRAIQAAAAKGYRYRDGDPVSIHRLLPFITGHKRTLFCRAEVETFVSALYAGNIEFLNGDKEIK